MVILFNFKGELVNVQIIEDYKKNQNNDEIYKITQKTDIIIQYSDVFSF